MSTQLRFKGPILRRIESKVVETKVPNDSKPESLTEHIPETVGSRDFSINTGSASIGPFLDFDAKNYTLYVKTHFKEHVTLNDIIIPRSEIVDDEVKIVIENRHFLDNKKENRYQYEFVLEFDENSVQEIIKQKVKAYNVLVLFNEEKSNGTIVGEPKRATKVIPT